VSTSAHYTEKHDLLLHLGAVCGCYLHGRAFSVSAVCMYSKQDAVLASVADFN
jgi:hypothetical protein